LVVKKHNSSHKYTVLKVRRPCIYYRNEQRRGPKINALGFAVNDNAQLKLNSNILLHVIYLNGNA